MITKNFWPLLHHLLTEEGEGFDATVPLLYVSHILPSLATKTPSLFERKVFTYLHDYADTYQLAPSRMMFFTAMSPLATPADSQDMQDFATRIQTGALVHFNVSDTQNLMDQYEEGRDIHLFQTTYQQGMEIYAGRVKIDGKELYGLKDALEFTQRHLGELGSSSQQVERHDLSEDSEELYSQYLAEQKDQMYTKRIMTGLPEIDRVVGGFYRGSMVSIMGDTGDGKTTLCINWAYQAYLQGLNVVIVTLEMPAEVIKKLIHIRHAANPKFEGMVPQLVKTKDYTDFKLTEAEEQFIYRVVVPDFHREMDDVTKGSIRVIEPREASFNYDLLKSELLRLNAERPLDAYYLDYPNLMEITSDRNMDFTRGMNRLYIKLKNLCRTFNNGQRITGFIPTQVNREGRAAAEHSNGIYTLRAIAEYGEIAKSSDHVFYIYRDPALVQADDCLIGHLKARLSARAEAFKANFIGPQGIICTTLWTEAPAGQGMAVSSPGQSGGSPVISVHGS